MVSEKNKKFSASQIKREKERKKEKVMKAIIAASASVLAAAIIILLAIFVIKPAVEKKKIEKEKEQTTAYVPEKQDGEYGEYMGCRMPLEFANLLNQGDADTEAACRESGVAAEIGGHKLSVPEYALYYYRTEIDQLTKAVKSVSERGQNLTGFDPSKAPSAQKYIKDEITWQQKLTDNFTAEIERNYFLFDEAIKAGFVPDEETLNGILEFFEYLAMSTGGYNSLDDFISSNYFEGLTFAMFAKKEIISGFAEAYANSLRRNKAESYSKNFVDGIFNNSPKKYKSVTVNILPIENKDSVDEAKKVKNFSEFCAFAKKEVNSDGFDPKVHTESYEVMYDDISDYYGYTVADWIFSPERKAGDTGVVAGAIYNCLISLNELPKVTHSRDILAFKIDSDESKAIDDAFIEAEGIYKELGGEKMAEEAFRTYLSENSPEYELTVFVGTFENELDKWVHSADRKQGDSICFKGENSAYIIMFIKDNPEDVYSDKIIRADTAYDEIEKYIEGNQNEISLKKSIVKKSVEIAEARYLEYYDTQKDKIGF